MNKIISPDSPELDIADLIALAGYAKHLGRAPYKSHRRPPRAGAHQSRTKGHGMEMLEVRQYQASDEFRHIDWRVTARSGIPHTRIYAEENQHHRQLLLDLTGAGYFGTQDTFISTRMAQVLALIAWRNRLQNDTLGFSLCYGAEQEQQPHLPDKFGLQPLLTKLAAATKIHHRDQNTQQKAPWQSLDTYKKIKNQDVIICSDRQQLTQQDLHHLSHLARHNYLHWLRITDTNVFKLPHGQYALAAQNGTQWVNVSHASLSKAQDHLDDQRLIMQHALSQCGVNLHDFSLSESPIQIARQLLALGVIR